MFSRQLYFLKFIWERIGMSTTFVQGVSSLCFHGNCIF